MVLLWRPWPPFLWPGSCGRAVPASCPWLRATSEHHRRIHHLTLAITPQRVLKFRLRVHGRGPDFATVVDCDDADKSRPVYVIRLDHVFEQIDAGILGRSSP